jgi:hypothetical protein
MDPNPEDPQLPPVVEVSPAPVIEEIPAPVVEVPPSPVVEEIPANTLVLDTPIEKTFKLLGFRVTVINLQLGEYARLAIHLNCMRGEERYTEYKELLLEGEDYRAWGSDDKYIIDFVQSKLSNLF